LQAIADEIAHDEQQQVLLLRSTFGKYAVAKPEINLNALGTGLGSFRQFLDVARILEDTGVSAYGGAAPLISSKTYLRVAAQIALTEALHAANLRLLVAENYVQSPAFDKYDVPPPPVGTKYFTNNSQGLAVVRTPQEVLSIVYGTKTRADSSRLESTAISQPRSIACGPRFSRGIPSTLFGKQKYSAQTDIPNLKYLWTSAGPLSEFMFQTQRLWGKQEHVFLSVSNL
jgi:hypothetical protein